MEEGSESYAIVHHPDRGIGLRPNEGVDRDRLRGGWANQGEKENQSTDVAHGCTLHVTQRRARLLFLELYREAFWRRCRQ